MKIAVFSDTHFCRNEMTEIVELLKPDMVIHLGDDVSDANALRDSFPKLTVVGVAGNSLSDMMSGETRTKCMEFFGYNIMMTHGHDYSVKYGLTKLAEAAESRDASIALYGHTHIAADEEIKGIRCINPGSMMLRTNGERSYALIEVEKGRFDCRIMRLKKYI